MVDKILEVKELIVFVISLIISISIFLAKLKKSKNLQTFALNLLAIQDVIRQFMCQAEEFKGFVGNEKLEWVKTKVNQYCIDEGISYDDKIISAAIENFIHLSKIVNKREKEMEKL